MGDPIPKGDVDKRPCTRGAGESGVLSPGQTAYGLWRSLVSALDWGSRGPGFKSRQPDHKDAGQWESALW